MTRVRRFRLTGTGARLTRALLVLPAAGCATVAPQSPVLTCVVAETAPAPSIRVAVTDSIDPAHAPVPTNRHERLLFAQLYESLMRIGCDGAVMPALAMTWSAAPDGRTWRFALREDVAFTEGTPLDARTLAASWSSSRHVPPLAGVEAIGQYSLQVRLHESVGAAFFAQPALAVTRAPVGSGWPHGTGANRAIVADGALELVRRLPSAGSPDTLHVEQWTAGDERSALDAGVDLLVTAEPATIEYARLLDAYTTTPLPFDRTYALVTGAYAPSVPPTLEERSELARDAASVGTRAAQDASVAECSTVPVTPVPPAAASPARDIRRILYVRGDAVARGVAERIAALSWPASRTPGWLGARIGVARASSGPLTAIGVDERALMREMQSARDAAFVVALRDCAGYDAMRDALVERGFHATPLVEARDHLIHRDGGRIMVDGSGVLHMGARR